MKKSHLGLGVVAFMSLKGTATLTAAFLLPTWPARFVALGIIGGIAGIAVVRHRRKRTAEVSARVTAVNNPDQIR